MRMLVFIAPAIIGCSIVLAAMVIGNEDLRKLLMSILALIWALIRWPFEALLKAFRR